VSRAIRLNLPHTSETGCHAQAPGCPMLRVRRMVRWECAIWGELDGQDDTLLRRPECVAATPPEVAVSRADVVAYGRKCFCPACTAEMTAALEAERQRQHAAWLIHHTRAIAPCSRVPITLAEFRDELATHPPSEGRDLAAAACDRALEDDDAEE
jgi:hypothetical protein